MKQSWAALARRWSIDECALPAGGHIPSLDGIRGIAVLLVMAFHFGLPDLRWIGPVFQAGWTGVDLFFVLSGFLITGILNDTKDTHHFFLNFYTRRVLRIFPLYYGVLIAVFLIMPALTGLRITSSFGQWPFWLYCSNFAVYFSGWAPLPLAHFWSLAVEEQFYIAWPLIVWACSPKRQLRLCVVTILVINLARVAAVLMRVSWVATTYLTPFRVDALLMGAAIVILVRERHSILRRAPLVCAAAGLLISVIMLWKRGLPLTDPIVRVLIYPLVGVFFASLIVISLAGPMAALMSFGPLRTMGKYSYGLYVYHQLLLAAWDRMFPTPVLGIALHALLSFGATFGIAFLSWHLFENRFLRLKRYFDPQRKRREEPQADTRVAAAV